MKYTISFLPGSNHTVIVTDPCTGVILAALPVIEIPACLDAGDFDEPENLAAHLAFAWGKYHIEEPGLDYTDDHLKILRWAVIRLWIIDQTIRNGSAVFVCDVEGRKHTFPLIPRCERLAVINNIEGALIARHGEEQGKVNAIQFYRLMLTGEPGKSPAALSSLGLEMLTDLHRSFMSLLYQVGDVSAQPVIH